MRGGAPVVGQYTVADALEERLVMGRERGERMVWVRSRDGLGKKAAGIIHGWAPRA